MRPIGTMNKDEAYQAGYDAAIMGHPSVHHNGSRDWCDGYEDAKTDKILMNIEEMKWAAFKAFQRKETKLKTMVEDHRTIARLLKKKDYLDE